MNPEMTEHRRKQLKNAQKDVKYHDKCITDWCLFFTEKSPGEPEVDASICHVF